MGLIEALHILTRLVVCTSSSACIYLQWTLLWRAILRLGIHLHWMATVGLLVVGLVSAVTFPMIVATASVTVEQLGMCSLFVILLFLLVAYRYANDNVGLPYSQEEQGIPDHNRCELVMCPHTVLVYPKKSEVATLRYHPPPPPQPREELVIR